MNAILEFSLFSAVNRCIADSSMSGILIGRMKPKVMGSIAIKKAFGSRLASLIVMQLRLWGMSDLGLFMLGEKGFSSELLKT